MGYLQRPFGLFFLLLMLTMALQVALKKPLCIDSSIVYNINNIESERTETIYSCDQFKVVSFSSYFYENLNSLEAHLIKLEAVFSSLGITNKFTITLDNHSGLPPRETPYGIQIGKDLLATDQLEKALLQVSLKNRLKSSDIVFLQTLADFLMGDSRYQNLVSQALGQAFTEINVFEKQKIRRRIISRLRLYPDNDERNAIEKLKELFSSAQNPLLTARFIKNLNKSGFYDESELKYLKLDIIIDDSTSTDFDSKLTELAKNNPNIKVAFKNTDGLFLLPSHLKIPRTLEKKILTKYRLVFGGKKQNRTVVNDCFNNSDSLILIHYDKELKELNLGSLFSSSVNEFLSKNKEISFVQIHLPSYRLIYKDLGSITNYFDFVRAKSFSRSEYRAMGWRHTEWLKDLKAYRPIANIDVIQYFRVN